MIHFTPLQTVADPSLIQLLDVFSHKSNLNLVLEFLDTDLEAVIKDSNLVFQAADVKSWMLMMIKGLEFCHRNWVLHRVSHIEPLHTENPTYRLFYRI